MARTIQDRNFLVWEVFATTGKHGFEENPNIIFQCITLPASRPRVLAMSGTETEAQARIINGTDAELVGMLAQSKELA